jgi:CheY-like chemotaxis protein
MDNANQAQRKARLLVVEDEVNLLESIRTVLELDGYDVVTAENGAQALAQLRSGHPLPELIVSDIMMPVMSGIELLKEVRKNPGLDRHPFHLSDRAQRKSRCAAQQAARSRRLSDQAVRCQRSADRD